MSNLNKQYKEEVLYGLSRMEILKWNFTMIKIVIALPILLILFNIKMGDFKLMTITPFPSLMTAFFITKICIKKVQLEEMERNNNG